ncbi:hypothetical protein BVY00_02245 [bacterium G20]|nr:hypothetical protein BVY00_02245 [bacterium G20]
MENARIIIIEDNSMLRTQCRANLEAAKHQVVGEAGSVLGAVRLVDELTEEEETVDIAVVDGNLSRESEGGTDGERVANYIHEKLGNVTVIGWSLDGKVAGADMNVQKHDTWGLDAMVKEL